MLIATCPSLLYLASVLYLPKCAVFTGTGQIWHTCTFRVYNMEIKIHFSL